MAVLLHYPASGGWDGAAKDAIRVLVGARFLVPGVIGAVLQLPPLATLTQQAALAALTSDMPTTCGQQLLLDGLTQQRLQRVFGFIEAVLPSPAGTLMTGHLMEHHSATLTGALCMLRCACSRACVWPAARRAASCVWGLGSKGC